MFSWIKRREQCEQDAHERASADRDAQERDQWTAALNSILEEIRSYRGDQNTNEPKKLSIEKTAATAAVIAAILSFGSLLAFVCLSLRADNTTKRVSEDQLRQERATNRAFVNVPTLRIEAVNLPDGKINYWKVSPILENGGNTATREMNYFPGYLRWDEHALPAGTRWPDPDETDISFSKGSKHPIALGPKDAVPQATYVVTKQDQADLASGNLRLYILGQTTYLDVFDNETIHVTRFCFRLFGKVGDTGISSVYGNQRVVLPERIGLDARMCFRNNCTDKECQK